MHLFNMRLGYNVIKIISEITLKHQDVISMVVIICLSNCTYSNVHFKGKELTFWN